MIAIKVFYADFPQKKMSGGDRWRNPIIEQNMNLVSSGEVLKNSFRNLMLIALSI